MSVLPARLRSYRKSLAVLASVGLLGGALVATAAPAQAWNSSTVTITGHGYGHGRGMGQWGAYGYATDYGWNYVQILNHYYGGTTVKTVGLAPMTVDLTALDGLGSVMVSSGVAFSAGGVSVPANGAAKLTYVSATAYKLQVVSAGGCSGTLGAARTVASNVIKSSVAAPTSLPQMLTLCNTHRTYRGTLSLVAGNGATHVVNTVTMDDYLKGVVPRESIPSWGDAAGGKGMAALQAQAVAARSYAAVSNRYAWAKICDSTNCQVYGGAGSEGASIEDSRTNTAVTSTSTKCLVNSAGNVVSAEYSSSTGGYTAGGTFPAVPDLGDVESPYHNWSDSISATTVGNTFGVGTLTAITEQRNGLGSDGGRVLSVTITGTAGTDTETGSDFAYALGLMSDWFTVQTPPPPGPQLIYSQSLATPNADIQEPFGWKGDLPLACDWNGDGVDTGGVYRASTGMFYFRNTFSQASPLFQVNLGRAGDLPVCGDWDGNGTQTPGVYDPSTSRFYLMNTTVRTASTPIIQVLLGDHGFQPVAGDWNGSGKDSVGVFDPATAHFYLVNTLLPGTPRYRYKFGQPGQTPIAGDFDGDGKDTIGVFQNDKDFAYTNDLSKLNPATYVIFGQTGDQPLVGDWNKDKKDSIGLARGY